MKLVIDWDNGQAWEDHHQQCYTTDKFDSIQECKDRFEKENKKYNSYDPLKKDDLDYFVKTDQLQRNYRKKAYFGELLGSDCTIEVYELEDWFKKTILKKWSV